MMRRYVLGVLFAALISGCGDGDGDSTDSTNTNVSEDTGDGGDGTSEIVVPVDCNGIDPARVVSIEDRRFDDDTVRIQPGAVVRWVNRDDEQHTVTSGHPEGSDAGALFDSGVLDPGEEYCFQFTQIGTYEYFCALHPEEMRDARVIVTATANTGDDDGDDDRGPGRGPDDDNDDDEDGNGDDDDNRGGGNDDPDNPS